jgi:hypothetical protein
MNGVHIKYVYNKSPADLLPAGLYVKEEEILFFITQKGGNLSSVISHAYIY